MRTNAAVAAIAAVAALSLAARAAAAEPSVWVIDDGEKILRDATSTPFEHGDRNPVWKPGEPARLFAMRNESVALQVVVEADDVALEGVRVELPRLDGPDGATLEDSAFDAKWDVVGRPIERFVEHFVRVERASGGRTPRESLGWETGSGPDADAWVGAVPDALVPVEHAPAWAPYPMRIAPRTNGIVWIDVNVPASARAGEYRGTIEVAEGDRALASIPVELEIAEAALPDRTAGAAMVYYDRANLERRAGAAAESHLWKLLHAHRVAPMHDLESARDVRRVIDALDGSLYTRRRGYAGPAQGLGDGVVSIGSYGSLGPPSETSLARVTEIAHALSDDKVLGGTDVLLYAADEECDSTWGEGWRTLIRGADDRLTGRVRVAWTCSRDPSAQPVDVAMLLAQWNASQVRAARERGKDAWVYNGIEPRTGTFLLDAEAIAPRVNGWLAAMFGVRRWFYWEATFWYGRHDARPIDPFFESESLHDDDGDWANGDGVLVYPGRQVDMFQEHSLDFDGVVASIRLKNWRRGIEDAGYLELARARDPQRADAVARWLVPAAFAEAEPGSAPSWGARGDRFWRARRALLAIATGQTAEALAPPVVAPQSREDRIAGGARTASALGATVSAASVVAMGLLAIARTLRRRSSHRVDRLA